MCLRSPDCISEGLDNLFGLSDFSQNSSDIQFKWDRISREACLSWESQQEIGLVINNINYEYFKKIVYLFREYMS